MSFGIVGFEPRLTRGGTDIVINSITVNGGGSRHRAPADRYARFARPPWRRLIQGSTPGA